MVGVAVNVTLVPAPGQMSVVFAAIVTLGVTLLVTLVVIPLLVAVLAVWQRLLAVNTTVTSSLLASVVVVNVDELVPVLVPFTFH